MLALEGITYLVLPVPISTNHLFNNVAGKGRVMTSEYAQWKRRAQQILMTQRPLHKYALPVEITFLVGEKGVGQMDSDNTNKAYLDALVAAKVIRDDSRKWVRSCRAQWVPGISGAVARIRPAKQPPTAAEVLAAIRPGLRSLLT